MDLHQLVQNSVANIQDELRKILTLSSLFESKPPEQEDAFRKRLLREYNAKIHKVRSENARLYEKNKILAEKVKYLEAQVLELKARDDTCPVKARPFKSESAISFDHDSYNQEPSRKRRAIMHGSNSSEILSSPIKETVLDKVKVSPLKKIGSRDDALEITSSQFNKLATQYSDEGSQADSAPAANSQLVERFPMRPPNISLKDRGRGPGLQLRSSSPLKNRDVIINPEAEPIIRGSFASDDESEDNSLPSGEQIADSQEEFEPLGHLSWSQSKSAKMGTTKLSAPTKPKYPAHYTALQRVEFLRNYYKPKITDKNFKADFSRNPITEKKWALEDFVPNENWKPPEKINSNLGVMTKAQEKTYYEFFDKAGLGRKVTGPTWDSDEDSEEGVHTAGWTRSQVMDKYLSPPGFMLGDFAGTQEMEERKRLRFEKEQERIKRRFKSAISGGEFLFYESIFNDLVAAGKYVGGP